MATGEGVLVERDWSPVGLNLPTTDSSSGLVDSFMGAPGVFKGPETVWAIASSERISADCADAMARESALSGTSLSAVGEASGDSLHSDGLSNSGGQVVRAEISSSIGVASRRGVLSLGVGIEAN